MAVALGPNPSQELFCFVVFATSMLMLGLQEEDMLTWDEFKLFYDSVYPKGVGVTPLQWGGCSRRHGRHTAGPLRGISGKL
jgi:hypothetical protein